MKLSPQLDTGPAHAGPTCCYLLWPPSLTSSSPSPPWPPTLPHHSWPYRKVKSLSRAIAQPVAGGGKGGSHQNVLAGAAAPSWLPVLPLVHSHVVASMLRAASQCCMCRSSAAAPHNPPRFNSVVSSSSSSHDVPYPLPAPCPRRRPLTHQPSGPADCCGSSGSRCRQPGRLAQGAAAGPQRQPLTAAAHRQRRRAAAARPAARAGRPAAPATHVAAAAAAAATAAAAAASGTQRRVPSRLAAA